MHARTHIRTHAVRTHSYGALTCDFSDLFARGVAAVPPGAFRRDQLPKKFPRVESIFDRSIDRARMISRTISFPAYHEIGHFFFPQSLQFYKRSNRGKIVWNDCYQLLRCENSRKRRFSAHDLVTLSRKRKLREKGKNKPAHARNRGDETGFYLRAFARSTTSRGRCTGIPSFNDFFSRGDAEQRPALGVLDVTFRDVVRSRCSTTIFSPTIDGRIRRIANQRCSNFVEKQIDVSKERIKEY